MKKSKLRAVRKSLDNDYDQVFAVYEIDGVTYERSIDIVPKIEGGDDENE